MTTAGIKHPSVRSSARKIRYTDGLHRLGQSTASHFYVAMSVNSSGLEHPVAFWPFDDPSKCPHLFIGCGTVQPIRPFVFVISPRLVRFPAPDSCPATEIELRVRAIRSELYSGRPYPSIPNQSLAIGLTDLIARYIQYMRISNIVKITYKPNFLLVSQMLCFEVSDLRKEFNNLLLASASFL